MMTDQGLSQSEIDELMNSIPDLGISNHTSSNTTTIKKRGSQLPSEYFNSSDMIIPKVKYVDSKIHRNDDHILYICRHCNSKMEKVNIFMGYQKRRDGAYCNKCNTTVENIY